MWNPVSTEEICEQALGGSCHFQHGKLEFHLEARSVEQLPQSYCSFWLWDNHWDCVPLKAFLQREDRVEAIVRKKEVNCVFKSAKLLKVKTCVLCRCHCSVLILRLWAPVKEVDEQLGGHTRVCFMNMENRAVAPSKKGWMDGWMRCMDYIAAEIPQSHYNKKQLPNANSFAF